jgi:adenylylsulfate kinase
MHTKIIWFTGLSGTGKTTLANAFYKLLKRKKYKTRKIDGDIFREKKNNLNNFTKKNIIKNNLSIINYISKIKNNYEYILVAVISPILKTRQLAKKKFRNNYYEIYVHCSIKTLEKRDTKGLYDDAKKKIIKNLIGYNSLIKYQKSRYSKIDINTDKFNLKQCIQILKNKINLKST